MYRRNKIIAAISLLLVVTTANAALSVGEVSENLFGPLEVLTRLMVAVSYVMGLTMLVFGLLQFKAHRQNPKLVPLTVPIMMALLGVILLLLPYFTKIFGSWSATSEEQQTATSDFIHRGENTGAAKYYYEYYGGGAEGAEQLPPEDGYQQADPQPDPAPAEPDIYSEEF